MSLVQVWFGAAGVKLRANRFGAMGRSCLLSVVTTNFLLPLALMPWRCISFRTRSLPTRTPRASSSFHIFGQPYSCLTSAWMALMCTSRASSLMRLLAPGRLGLPASLRRQCSN
jgi:hypothetical protein